MMLGSEEIKAVQAEGAKVDFFSTHGHKPMGVWPDMRSMYDCFNGFAELGVKMHISEATLDLGQRFMSPVRPEKAWTPELAAEFYKNYYTVAFSHPAMEAINYWDLSTSINRASGSIMSIGGTGQAGLLDPEKNDEPRPLYYMLKKLIRQDWMTHLKGNLSSDGAVAFRGFHGDYEITLTTPSGKALHGTFTINPDSPNKLHLKLMETPTVAQSK
jgi:hypothetical protein